MMKRVWFGVAVAVIACTASTSFCYGQVRLLGLTGNQGLADDITLFEINVTDATITEVQALTRLPDTHAIGYNPVDGLLYHTGGSDAWTNDTGRGDPPGLPYRDNQYMESVNLDTKEITAIFNANPCPSPDELPCTPDAPVAPRPDFVLPAEVRTIDQTDGSFRSFPDGRSRDEYHGLRGLTWSAAESLFYASDEFGIFKLTPDGKSTFLAQPDYNEDGSDIHADPGARDGADDESKGIAFVNVNGQDRLYVGERGKDDSGDNLYQLDPATGEILDRVTLSPPSGDYDRFTGLIAIAQHPETGIVYGVHRSDDPSLRELVTINVQTGDTAVVEALGLHFNSLAFVGIPTADPALQAGDANQDLQFDQFDLIKVQQAATYLSGQPATWGGGDWDGAPGGKVGEPPAGDGLFNQLDIIAALNTGLYLTGPYAAIAAGGTEGDGQTSIGYDPGTGQVWVDAPAGVELTSVNIDSAGGIFTGEAAQNLGGSFDNDADGNIFKATFGGSFGTTSFGNVAQAGLSQDFLVNDLTVVGSLAGGGDLGNVDLIYVPEPSSLALLAIAALAGIVGLKRRR